MRTLLIALIALTLTASSCKTVYSTTTIEAKKGFVLGDNEHDAFEATLKNISREDLELYQMPNGGTKQLLQTLKSNKTATVKYKRIQHYISRINQIAKHL